MYPHASMLEKKIEIQNNSIDNSLPCNIMHLWG